MYRHTNFMCLYVFAANAASIAIRHFGAYLLIAKTTKPALTQQTMPTMVKSHPSPIAEMIGCVMTPPIQLKMLRTKLLTATPLLARLGMNSVNIVVATPKMIMLPRPKKKLAKHGATQRTPFSAVHPYH